MFGHSLLERVLHFFGPFHGLLVVEHHVIDEFVEVEIFFSSSSKIGVQLLDQVIHVLTSERKGNLRELLLLHLSESLVESLVLVPGKYSLDVLLFGLFIDLHENALLRQSLEGLLLRKSLDLNLLKCTNWRFSECLLRV